MFFNFNKKKLILSILIIFFIAYIFPGKSLDGFSFNYGYPFEFFTVYNTKISYGDTILNSISFNVVGFLLNVVVLYFILDICSKFFNKILLKREV